MQSKRWWESFANWVDDISCLAFCVASTVTIQFWTLHIITGGMVEDSSDRPEWLGFAVHVLNSVLAWLDIILGRPRRFSPRGRRLCLQFVAVYSTMICACRCSDLLSVMVPLIFVPFPDAVQMTIHWPSCYPPCVTLDRFPGLCLSDRCVLISWSVRTQEKQWGSLF
jgi:hypothetical protein